MDQSQRGIDPNSQSSQPGVMGTCDTTRFQCQQDHGYFGYLPPSQQARPQDVYPAGPSYPQQPQYHPQHFFTHPYSSGSMQQQAHAGSNQGHQCYTHIPTKSDAMYNAPQASQVNRTFAQSPREAQQPISMRDPSQGFGVRERHPMLLGGGSREPQQFFAQKEQMPPQVSKDQSQRVQRPAQQPTAQTFVSSQRSSTDQISFSQGQRAMQGYPIGRKERYPAVQDFSGSQQLAFVPLSKTRGAYITPQSPQQMFATPHSAQAQPHYPLAYPPGLATQGTKVGPGLQQQGHALGQAEYSQPQNFPATVCVQKDDKTSQCYMGQVSFYPQGTIITPAPTWPPTQQAKLDGSQPNRCPNLPRAFERQNPQPPPGGGKL